MAENTETYLLTHTEAKLRSSTISDVSYTLRLGLTNTDMYSGHVVVKFNHKDLSSGIWLDFKGSNVESVTINSEPAEIKYKDFKLWLSNLVQGHNEVIIEYENKYSNDGLGLHGYRDPVDNELYLYTQHEPFAANRTFPCFDQPDLKATLELTVTAPSH